MAKKKNGWIGARQRNQKTGDGDLAGRGRQRWLIFGAFTLIALIAVILTLSLRPPAARVNAAGLNDDRALGPKTAPVTIVEYGDFGCSACKEWFRAGILRKLRSRYGDRIRFVFRDFPVITPQSPKAAEAGQCAHDQGKFWEYHDRLYSATAIDVSYLKAYAAEIGLDGKEFNQCLESGRHSPAVKRDLQDAIARGFRGTPSFLVNDQPLKGLPSFEAFQGIIDPILSSGR